MKTCNPRIRPRAADFFVDADGVSGNSIVGYGESQSGSLPPRKKQRYDSDASNGVIISRSSNTGQADAELNCEQHVGTPKILQMPMDVLCEIAAHLEPLDLIHLARCSKLFNCLLMSRSSKSIWCAARSSLHGLPECPPDLSEPAYAGLLFEKHCQVCMIARVSEADCVLSTRLCEDCAQSRIVRGGALLEMIPDLTEDVLECVPSCKNFLDFRTRAKYFRKDQVLTLLAKFRSAIPEDLADEEKIILQEEFLNRNKQLALDVEQQGMGRQSWMESYVRAMEFEQWNTARRRKASIKEKLEALGYSLSDFPTDRESSEWDFIVHDPTDLTPGIWEKLQPQLEACLAKVKVAREEEARQRRESTRKWELSPLIDSLIKKRAEQDKQLLMTFDAALRLPAVTALLEEDDFHAPITQERWDAMTSQVEKEMDDYADNARHYLRDLIHNALCNSPGLEPQFDHVAASASMDGEESGCHDIVPLDLAYFRCSECACDSSDPALKYPGLLGHDHPMRAMIFDDSLTKYARYLRPFLGGVNEDELCTFGCQFLCLRCDQNYVPFRNWSSLITHFRCEQEYYENELCRQSDGRSPTKAVLFNDHSLQNPGMCPPAFRIFEPDEAKAWESALQGTITDEWEYHVLYTCALCEWNQPETLRKEVESHIRHKHLKEPAPEDIVKYSW